MSNKKTNATARVRAKIAIYILLSIAGLEICPAASTPSVSVVVSTVVEVQG